MKEVDLEKHTICIYDSRPPLKVHVVEKETGNAWCDVIVQMIAVRRLAFRHEQKVLEIQGEDFDKFSAVYEQAQHRVKLLSYPAVPLRIWAEELAEAVPVPLVTARDWAIKGRINAYRLGRDWLIAPTERPPR